MDVECLICKTKLCYGTMKCPECRGTGIFIGAGIGGGAEPNYYGLARPVRLDCSCCGGSGEVNVYCEHY